MTPEAIEELRRLEREAFKAPWTYSEWEIECPDHDSIDDCKNPECDGSHVPCTTIESPDEYPDGQVVAQITCPGLSCLADKQGAFIVAMRNALPALLDELSRERELREAAEKEAEWRRQNDISRHAPDDIARCRIEKGDETWHDGPGWYYIDSEYEDEGSCGAFETLAECVLHACAADYFIESIDGRRYEPPPDSEPSPPDSGRVPGGGPDGDGTVRYP